jgi:hypothetical protein
MSTQLYFSKIGDKNAPQSAEFNSNEFIFAHLKTEQALSSVLTLDDRPVSFRLEYSENGKVLEYEDYAFEAKNIKSVKESGYVVLPIVSDPQGNCVSYQKNQFATYFPKVLASLSVGKHTIECKVFCYSYKDGNTPLASGKFDLNILAGAKDWYNKNANDSYNAMINRGITFTLEKYYAPTSVGSSSSKSSKVKVKLQSFTNDVRVKIQTDAGTYLPFVVQKNITTDWQQIVVGSKIELLTMDAPYDKIKDILTITSDLEGKTIDVGK